MRIEVMRGGQDLLTGFYGEAVINEGEPHGRTPCERNLLPLASRVVSRGLSDLARKILGIGTPEFSFQNQKRVLIEGTAVALDRLPHRTRMRRKGEGGEMNVFMRGLNCSRTADQSSSLREAWFSAIDMARETAALAASDRLALARNCRRLIDIHPSFTCLEFLATKSEAIAFAVAIERTGLS